MKFIKVKNTHNKDVYINAESVTRIAEDRQYNSLSIWDGNQYSIEIKLDSAKELLEALGVSLDK